MILKFRILVLSAFLVGLCSCGILFIRKTEPRAKFCFFDPNINSIIFRAKNNGIKKIEIDLITNTDAHISTYHEEVYNIPVDVVDLSKLDTVILKKNYVLIKIWDQSPVLEDYDIIIEPSAWSQTKKIYSRYNTR
jgi:hypothetical protein